MALLRAAGLRAGALAFAFFIAMCNATGSKEGTSRRSLQQMAALPLTTAAPAPSPTGGTDGACCAMLAAINFSSNLPVVVVNTDGATVTRTASNSSLCTCSQGLKHGDFSGEVAIKIRGGTDSQLRNQILQFGVKLPKKESFLGMPKSKNWILYGQQLDPFGLHNWLGFNLARATDEYAPRTQFCELFVVADGTPLDYAKHYWGIYVGLEKIEQESNRVDIAQNNITSDPSGGFLMEFSHEQNPSYLPTVNGSISHQQWLIKYPKQKNLTPPQLDFLQGYLDDFETALYGPSFPDPVIGWRKYGNETAFVDWFLVIELVRNAKHSYHSSAFMTKNADVPFQMGPLWDNVQGFGACCGYPVQGYNNSGASTPNPASGGNGISSSGWLFNVCENHDCPVLDSYDPTFGISVWFQQLWKDPTWIAACAKRYTELRQGPWATPGLQALITSTGTELQPAAIRTLNRWTTQLYQPKYFATPDAAYTATTQQLSDWLTSRLEWLDSAFHQASTPGLANGPYPSSYPAANGLSTAG